MKQSLFIGVICVLILVSGVFLFISSIHNQPEEFIEILIGVLLITSLMFVIERDGNLLRFIVHILAVGVAAVLLGVVYFWIGAAVNPDPGNLTSESVLGIRLLSLIWPFVVLVIGVYNYLLNPKKEKVEQEEPVLAKEEPKAEQKL